MAVPDREPGAPVPHDARRERLTGLLVLGVAVVLLISSSTWFGTGRQAVGTGQVICGLLLAGVGAFLYRRSSRS